MSKQYDFGLEITGIKEDKFIPEYKNARLNVCDVDSELFQRTPEDNDRPELEKYYSRLPKDENGNSELVWFCGFVIPYNYDEIYKLTPEKVAEYARRDFAQRVLIRIPDNKLKYYVHLNRLK